jgi:hypothetical protein
MLYLAWRFAPNISPRAVNVYALAVRLFFTTGTVLETRTRFSVIRSQRDGSVNFGLCPPSPS